MPKCHAWKVALLLVIAAIGSPAAAASTVYEADLFAPGDGLLTRDPVLGLDWLDVNQTLGLSAIQIRAGVGGWAALGFEHATTGDVCSLMGREAFAMTVCGTLSQEQVPGDVAADLQALVGATSETGGPSEPSHLRQTAGIFDRGAFADDEAGWARLQYFRTSVGANETSLIVDGGLSGGSVWSAYSSDPEVGHFLVRQIAIPEPTSGQLVFLAIVAAVTRSRRGSLRVSR